jgi:Fur family ferric uptake transcriptional regulator
MSNPKEIIYFLRNNGYRLTQQRELIIEAFINSNRHMTAEDVFELTSQEHPSINIATIYRTLNMLVDEGLAIRTDLGQELTIYATPTHGPHIHLVCRNCGQVIDADHNVIVPLGQKLDDEYGFQAALQHVAIFGTCEKCLSGFEPKEIKIVIKKSSGENAKHPD